MFLTYIAHVGRPVVVAGFPLGRRLLLPKSVYYCSIRIIVHNCAVEIKHCEGRHMDVRFNQTTEIDWRKKRKWFLSAFQPVFSAIVMCWVRTHLSFSSFLPCGIFFLPKTLVLQPQLRTREADVKFLLELWCWKPSWVVEYWWHTNPLKGGKALLFIFRCNSWLFRGFFWLIDSHSRAHVISFLTKFQAPHNRLTKWCLH